MSRPFQQELSGNPRIILGSTSRYRAELLRRLVENFEQRASGTDEAAMAGEAPPSRALRLATAKARAVAAGLHNALVIGSDQVAELDNNVLDKPGTVEGACRQLQASSAHRVDFHTAYCVLDTRNGHEHLHVDRTQVHFRHLSEIEIERYVAHENPIDCAGSFKCEGLGISLFERISTQDPTALIGLPLIALAGTLRHCEISIP